MYICVNTIYFFLYLIGMNWYKCEFGVEGITVRCCGGVEPYKFSINLNKQRKAGSRELHMNPREMHEQTKKRVRSLHRPFT